MRDPEDETVTSRSYGEKEMKVHTTAVPAVCAQSPFTVKNSKQ